MSRRGSSSHPDDAARVQSWRAMADALHARYDLVADEAVPKRLEIERLVRQPRKWIYGAIAATLAAFIAGGGVGWVARGAAAAPSAFQSFTVDALDAHRLYVVEVRHPVEVPGSERAHLQQWLTKRCGWDVRAPELAAAGLKLVGGRLLPGPTGPASFLMYESAIGRALHDLQREGAKPRRRRCAMRRKATRARCSGPTAASPMWCSGGSDRGRLTQIAQAGLRPDGEGGG